MLGQYKFFLRHLISYQGIYLIELFLKFKNTVFNLRTLEIQLLKGVYRLSIAEGGGIKYTEGNGHAGFREVTISNTPVELLDNTEVLTVELILK